jgi:DNA-3-methyladenine glycosylase II
MNKNKIYDLLNNDLVLKRLINKYGILPETPLVESIYQDLVSSIVSQQLSIKAAATIYERFSNEMDGEVTPSRTIDIEHERLRSIGLSNQKATYVKEVARYWQANPNMEEDIWQMEDEEIIKQLTSIKGVGVWTVQMLLIFALARPNVLPLGDLIVRKGIIHHYGLNESDKDILLQCSEVVKHWSPYSSYGSRYMWASKEEIGKSK